jgi:hypothetical protein
MAGSKSVWRGNAVRLCAFDSIGIVAAAAAAFGFAPPAGAEADISGFWQRIRHEWEQPEGGPELGDYSLYPLNEEALSRAHAYDPAIDEVQQQRQCWPHSIGYAMFSLAPLHIRRESDRIVFRVMANEALRTVWMDGRAHPPEHALHTWYGFSTGKWVDNTLVVTTTHVKEGHVRRNGVPHSDQINVTEYFTRHGDDLLTMVAVFDDPIYLTEPLVRHMSFRYDPNAVMPEYPCEERELVELGGAQLIPHFLPGENPFLEGSSLNYFRGE